MGDGRKRFFECAGVGRRHCVSSSVLKRLCALGVVLCIGIVYNGSSFIP